MPEIIRWPGNLVITDRSNPMLVSNTRSGGRALNGQEQIVSPGSKVWQWQIQVPIYRQDHIRALSILLDTLDGRYGHLMIAMCDASRITRREMGAFPFSGPGVPHSDGAYFSDDTGYALAGGMSVPVGVYASGASSMVMAGVTATGGVPFSINGWLYRVTSVDDDGRVNFQPPLREPISDDDEILWKPEVIWRLSTDTEGQSFLRLGKFGSVNINLTEPVMRKSIK